ncbi:DNA glycosylase [Aureobasidium sp. EXF-10727]|nr:DNA glycosylase [Aureobasidium sp. EXF-10727]
MALRPEDPVAAAAKVIRIIHNDHAAQSRYLHALKVTPGESHLETKSVLQCMEQEEYQDVLTDLEPPQKATFFDKVAAMSEKPSENPSTLDEETTKLYFEALGLSAKGLSFKDVCAEIKKRPAMTTSTLAQSTAAPKLPSTPPTSKPYRETKIEVKELNPKDKPAQKAVKPAAPVAPKAPTAPASKQQKEKKDNKDKKDKKRKREDDTPKTSKKPKTEPEVPVGGSKKRQKRREKQRALLGKVAAGEVPPVSKPAVQEAPKTEKTLPVAPLSASEEKRTVDERMQLDSSDPAPLEVSEPAPSKSTVQANPKSKKVRRSKHKSEKTKSKPVETEQPIQPSAPEPSTILETEISAQVEGSKKSRNRRARKAKAAEIPVTIPPPPVAPVAREDSAPAGDPAPTEDASTSSSDEADNDDDLPPKEGTMSDFIRRTTLPMLGKPTISAIADSSSDDEDEQEMTSASVEHKEAIEGKVVPGEADKESNSEIQREISSEALREESPSPPTRETSVSSHEKVPSPPRQQEQKKSSPVIKKTELPKAAPSSFISAPSQSSLHRPTLSNSFSKPQSSFTSTRSLSIPSTNTNTKKSGTDAYAEFSAFVSGKKLGYDSSDDDDDSSSSSSSSDDERPAPVQTRKSSPVQPQPYKAPSISPIAAPEPEVEASAMDVDTEVGATPEHTDPVMPAIDVVMTNEEENVSSPMEYNDSPPSIHEETENVAEGTTDDNSAAFQSFHESSVPKDAPLTQVPLPEIPSPEALMEFGGYQPSTTEATEETDQTKETTPINTEEQEQPSEPVNLETQEGHEVVDDRNSIELEVEAEGNDKASHVLLEAEEQAESSSEDEQSTEPAEETTTAGGRDAQIGETAQPSDLDPAAEEPVVDEQVLEAAEEVDEPENQEAEAETEDIAQSSHSDSEPEEPAEAFTNSMKDFLAAWEEEVDNFENRIEELRQLLVEDGDGSAEDNKDILEKLMNEVDREENIYKKKTTLARNALGGLERLARIKILEVLDRADSSFERRVMVVKDKLREEHNGESARSQLSPDTQESDVEMKDVPDLEAKPNVEGENSDDEQAGSSAESGSPAPSSLGWAPSEDEGLTESAKKEPNKTRKPRKSTGATSEHFTPSPKKKRVPAGTSAVPFPKLSAPRFGLIQERLANDPFRLLIAVTFLNKTAGRAAVPIFEQVMETYPTPADLAVANVSELSEMIHSLGFQNQRARKLIKIAETWIEQPPQKGKLHRTMDYPNKGNGRHLKPKETVDEDVEDCIEAGALEIAHIYGLGPYAWDSWRIFCRDVFRGVAEGYNGEGVTGYKPASQANDEAEFEPEWKRVVPLDKELRACLRWMWLREGWEWDPLTGNKKKAAPTLMREASDGVATWNEPVALDPHEDTTTIKEELEGPEGPEALVPGVKAEDVAPAPKRRTRRGRNSSGAAAKKRAATPPPAAPKEAATPIVPPSAKRLNADPEIMTSRLRPRAGRTDVIVSIPVAPTPSRRRAARK